MVIKAVETMGIKDLDHPQILKLSSEMQGNDHYSTSFFT